MVLCPVIEATSISSKPFSKSREVASCRRSWKVRPSMSAALQTRSKACEMESGRMPHTRPPMRLGRLSKTPSAAVESGTRRGVPVFVSGIRRTRALRSRWSQRIAAISPRRMAVSIAQVMRGAGLAPVGVGGGQEAREFVADQAAVAAAGELGALATDKFHGVTQGLHTPGGAGDVEEVGK